MTRQWNNFFKVQKEKDMFTQNLYNKNILQKLRENNDTFQIHENLENPLSSGLHYKNVKGNYSDWKDDTKMKLKSSGRN